MNQGAAAGRPEAGSSEDQGLVGNQGFEEDQVADLHQLLQLYKDEREQLSKGLGFRVGSVVHAHLALTGMRCHCYY